MYMGACLTRHRNFENRFRFNFNSHFPYARSLLSKNFLSKPIPIQNSLCVSCSVVNCAGVRQVLIYLFLLDMIANLILLFLSVFAYFYQTKFLPQVSSLCLFCQVIEFSPASRFVIEVYQKG
jgi:hypothetical protein